MRNFQKKIKNLNNIFNGKSEPFHPTPYGTKRETSESKIV